MEKEKTTVDEMINVSDTDDHDTNSASTSSEEVPEIQIESICIDLNVPLPMIKQIKDGEAHLHFSIRSYTENKRMQDINICLPFGLSIKPEEQLFPLEVPKSKYWRCKFCLREIEADESTGDAANYVAAILLTMEEAILSPNKPIGNESVKAGDGTGSKGVTEERVCKGCSTGGIETNSPSVAPNVVKSTNAEPIPSNDGVCKESKIGAEKERGSLKGKRTARKASARIKVLSSKENAVNMSNVKLRKDIDQISKEGDANLAEKSAQADLQENIAHDIPRRKPPKVRLVSDLLCTEANLENSCANAEQLSANTLPMVPSKPDTVAAAPKDKEDVGKGIKISQKKRNMPQEDGNRGMNLDGKMAKRSKTFNQNKKADLMENEVTGSGPGENGPDTEQRLQRGRRSVKNKPSRRAGRSLKDIEATGSCRLGENEPGREQRLQGSSKSVEIKNSERNLRQIEVTDSRPGENGTDKDSGASRKKHKQVQVVGECSLHMALKEKNSTGLESNQNSANIVFQSPHVSTSNGKLELHMRNQNVSLAGKEKDSGLSRNSNKLVEVRHSAPHLNVAPADKNLGRESVSKGKSVDQMPICMGMATSQPEKELSIKEKSAQSHMNVAPADKNLRRESVSKGKAVEQMPIGMEMATSQPEKELSIKEKSAQSHMNVAPADKNLRRESVSKGKAVEHMPIGMRKATSQAEKELSLREQLLQSRMNVAPEKNLQRESISKGKAAAQMPIGMGMVITSQPEKELSLREKLAQSLSSFRDGHKHVENDNIQSKSITNWPLTLQKDNKSCDPYKSNVSESGNSSGKGVNSLAQPPTVLESGHLRKGVNSFERPSIASESGQSLRRGVNPIVRPINVSELGQSLRKGLNPLVRQTYVPGTSVNPLARQTYVPGTSVSPLARQTYVPGTSVNPLARQTYVPGTSVNPLARQTYVPGTGLNPLARQTYVPRTGESAGKGMNPPARQTYARGTGEYAGRGVNPPVRQPNAPTTGQSVRKELIDLNQEIDLNQGIDLNQSQEIQSSSNLIQRGNVQIQKPMETPRASSRINLNEVQGYPYGTNPQQNQRPQNVIMERGSPIYAPPVVVLDMLARHNRIHPQTQSNLVIGPWLIPGSTNFHPFYSNINTDVGAIRGNNPHLSNVKVNSTTEMVQVQEQQFKPYGVYSQSQQKPSNGMQVSAPVPLGWRLQHGEGSNLLWYSVAQGKPLHDNPQNYLNQQNQNLVHEQSPASLQKGKTISDIKSMDSQTRKEWPRTTKRAGNDHSTKGMMGSSYPYSVEAMQQIQSLKFQEKPFVPCSNHPPMPMEGKELFFNGPFVSPQQMMESSSGVHMSGYSTVGQSSQQQQPADQVSVGASGGQDRKRKAHALARLSGRNLKEYASSSGAQRTNSKDDSSATVGRSTLVPLEVDNNVSKALFLEGRTAPVADALPIRIIPQKDTPCLFNQNPADIAEADDERYLRSAKVQRIRDKSSTGETSGAVKVDGRKRKRRTERRGRMPLAALENHQFC